MDSWALLLLRAGVATSFLVHGWQKRSMWKMQPSETMPAGLLRIIKLLSIVEPLGAAAMIAGFLTQPAAAGFAIIMVGAIRLKAMQMKKKFVAEGGWELDFILLAAATALFILGAGQFSIDYLLFQI